MDIEDIKTKYFLANKRQLIILLTTYKRPIT